MPIYEYVCKACGKQAEIIHKISDPPERKCPSCGKLKLSKLVSAAAFRLKGGGWYETDFKSGDKKNLVSETQEPDVSKETKSDKPAKEAAEAKPAAAKTEAKKDSKPLAKPAPATPAKSRGKRDA